MGRVMREVEGRREGIIAMGSRVWIEGDDDERKKEEEEEEEVEDTLSVQRVHKLWASKQEAR